MNPIVTWLKTHWFWVVLISIGLIFFRSWLGEHDARLASNAQERVSQANISALRQQTSVNDQAITTLRQQMADNDARTAQQVQALTVLVEKVKTSPQAAQATSDITDHNVTPVAQANGDVVTPQPQVIPLFQELAEGKQDGINHAACTQDLKASEQIITEKDANLALQVQVVAQKDKEIAVLKTPQGFWRRVGGGLKQIGIGVGVGITLAKFL